MVHLLKMNNEVPLNPSQNAFLRQCLPEWIHCESLKYRRWLDRQAFLGGRYLLLEGLKKLGVPIDIFTAVRYTKYGRPYLPLGIDFNISHSGQFILFAISDTQRIGIDIEEIKMIEFDGFRNQFTDLEFLQMNQASNKFTEFFKYWTIKEAVLKADGRGITMDLKSIIINENAYLDKQTWFIKEIKISSGYMAHIASNLIIPDDLNCDTVLIPEL